MLSPASILEGIVDKFTPVLTSVWNKEYHGGGTWSSEAPQTTTPWAGECWSFRTYFQQKALLKHSLTDLSELENGKMSGLQM